MNAVKPKSLAVTEATIELMKDMQRRGRLMHEISEDLDIPISIVRRELYWRAVGK